MQEYEDARNNYKQALQIFEFNDRYSQTSTYYQLGTVAEATGELEEAKANYLLDLQITAEFNDEHGLEISLRNLARFYQTTQDPDLIHTVAQVCNATVEQVQDYFRQVNSNSDA